MRRLGIFLAGVLCAAGAVAKPCPDCNTEVAEASRFCAACGKKFNPSKTCSECGVTAFAESRFCAGCGRRFPFALDDEERLVAGAATSRKEYVEHLKSLAKLYREFNLPEKAEAAEEEIRAVERAVRIIPGSARTGAGSQAAEPLARESIAEADALYAEADEFRRSSNLFKRKENLRKALEIYEKLILKYPTSDKADDCAYRMGEIYGSPYFESYEKALRCYEKCVVWNPDTDHDARYRAAEIADYRLSDIPAAIQWYRKAVEKDPVPDNRKAAEKRLKRLQEQSKEK